MAQTQTHTQTSQSIHPVILELLRLRGMDNQSIKDFFSWNLTELPNLTNMKDLEKAANRICEAIDHDHKIGIYGDYDVDGTTSCALLYEFFKILGVEAKLYQPSRFVEGYGLHISSIDKAKEDNIDVLMTVDCGITSCDAADYALERGIDLIITDHHTDAAEEMPKAFTVVNPNRRDEAESELGRLAGVGVAFALALKVRETLLARGEKIPSIYPLLQFVAIGTICDLAKLTPMNLKLCRHGLKQIPSTEYEGIKAFFSPEEREQAMIPSERISFFVGPMINSKGRLEHPEKALNLLISETRDEAYRYFTELEISNNERKFVQKEVFEAAREKVIQEMDGEELYSTIVYDPDFHEGVIGIVASKLVDNFKVPAIVFTDAEDEGIIKASARSAGELNLFDCLKECEEFFTKFGGHKAAAGLSMPKENFKPFKKKMNEILKAIPAITRTRQDHFDLEIKSTDVGLKLIKDLDLLEPFGMGNAKPIFRIQNLKLESYKILKDVHVKWTFVDPKTNVRLFGITFNYIGKWGCLDPADLFAQQTELGMTIHFTLGLNRFNGNEYIQLMVEKVDL